MTDASDFGTVEEPVEPGVDGGEGWLEDDWDGSAWLEGWDADPYADLGGEPAGQPFAQPVAQPAPMPGVSPLQQATLSGPRDPSQPDEYAQIEYLRVQAGREEAAQFVAGLEDVAVEDVDRVISRAGEVFQTVARLYGANDETARAVLQAAAQEVAAEEEAARVEAKGFDVVTSQLAAEGRLYGGKFMASPAQIYDRAEQILVEAGGSTPKDAERAVHQAATEAAMTVPTSRQRVAYFAKRMNATREAELRRTLAQGDQARANSKSHDSQARVQRYQARMRLAERGQA